jgi:hypothetical protein
MAGVGFTKPAFVDITSMQAVGQYNDWDGQGLNGVQNK